MKIPSRPLARFDNGNPYTAAGQMTLAGWSFPDAAHRDAPRIELTPCALTINKADNSPFTSVGSTTRRSQRGVRAAPGLAQG